MSARAKQEAGDCAGAVALAYETEDAALGGLSVDDEREPLKALYALLVACEHQLGHADGGARRRRPAAHAGVAAAVGAFARIVGHLRRAADTGRRCRTPA